MTYKLTIEDCREGDECETDRGAHEIITKVEHKFNAVWFGDFGYFPSQIRNLSAERRHAESQAKRPEWVRCVANYAGDEPYVTVGEIYRVIGPAQGIAGALYVNSRDRIVTLCHHQWEPAPAPEPQAAKEQEPLTAFIAFNDSRQPYIFSSVACDGLTPMIERRAYDAVVAERDALKSDNGRLRELVGMLKDDCGALRESIAKLERELDLEKKNHQNTRGVLAEQQPAAPTVEPYKFPFNLSFNNEESSAFAVCLETLSAQLAESNKLLAALVKDKK